MISSNSLIKVSYGSCMTRAPFKENVINIVLKLKKSVLVMCKLSSSDSGPGEVQVRVSVVRVTKSGTVKLYGQSRLGLHDGLK